ncbi:hypothetical protein [Mycoplasma todarodis]|uniref:hypothetical protein n=1 Tax=Mycoplasma todarodis TaxID=1937191 RepID=UPI003B35CE3C
MKLSKKRIVKVIATSTFTAAIALPTVISCGTAKGSEDKNDKDVFIKKPTYESLNIQGYDGEAKITILPYSPKEGVLVNVSKKKGLRNKDRIVITYIVDQKHDLTINGSKKVVFEYFVHGLKAKPVVDVKVKKPTYASLGITGESGKAILTTPPQGKPQYNVLINRTRNIKNKDVIEVTYASVDPSRYSINGKNSVTFSYTVQGLFEPKKVIDIKVSKQTLAINVTGDNGKGEFTIPKVPHATVTSTQHDNLSNGQHFTVTVRGEHGYTINGKAEAKFIYEVQGLKVLIIDQVVARPRILFRGFEGAGTFTLPQIPNMTVTADKITGLSNYDWVALTITANAGYTINGKHQQIIRYQVLGLADKTPQSNVKEIKPQKQGYNVKDLHHKTMMVGKQKTLIAWFGKDASDSPIVFMFGYKKFNSKFVKNAPTVAKPFINENELEEFVQLFLSRIAHGPELPSLGVITFDNEHMISQSPHAGGYVNESGLVRANKLQDIPIKPKNTAKSLMFINSGLAIWDKAINGHTPNFNGVKNKFDSIFTVIQHEYGHVLNHFQTWQKPIFIGRQKKIAPEEIIEAGIHNGYRPSSPQSKYVSKYLIEKLANMLGVDITDADNAKDTVFIDLLQKKKEIRNKGGDETFVNKQLALWTLRVMVGDFNDKLPDYLNRNKAYLYKGRRVTPNFYINYHPFGWDKSASRFKYRHEHGEVTIWDDYSSGFDEMLTRMFTNMFTKPKSYKIGATTLSSLLAGWDPYYTYKKNAFNFSRQTDGTNWTDWLSGTIKTNSWLTNGVQSDNEGMTIFTSFSSDAERLIKDGKGFRVPITDTTKRDKMIEFWRDTIMGYNKPVSTFIKESNELVEYKHELDKRQPWSLNVIGGWTKKQHQYLILNPSGTKDGIVKHNSTAYPIQDAHGYLAFRGNPEETWDNRTINFDKKKAWYVNFSDKYKGVQDLQRHLANQRYSFWDDNNNDGIIQKDEVTLIPWTDVRSLYPKTGKVFSGGGRQGYWQPPAGNHVGMELIGEAWVGSWSDLETALILKRTKDGGVKLANEIDG